MGGVSVDSGGKGGRKSVDANVNMVPMIDLLISVIAFLLMTAVWVQSGSLQASQPRGAPSPDTQPENQPDQLKIIINPNALQVFLTAADRRDISAPDRSARLEELRRVLRQRFEANRAQREVWLQPDSEVAYNDIIEIMDVIYEIWSGGAPPRGGQRIADMVTIRFL